MGDLFVTQRKKQNPEDKVICTLTNESEISHGLWLVLYEKMHAWSDDPRRVSPSVHHSSVWLTFQYHTA